ncbi:MAG: Mut7-C RNAse domain-containing protein [Thermoproteota archaeon]|nr:Mut7-C RNAse domain-containing protein [Thermoproteota archaeon]
MLEARSVAFLADAMLGNIARKLRIFGFDTLYMAQAHDDEILRTGIKQDRVILTADKELFKRIVKVGARGVLVSAGASELEDLVHILTENGITSIGMNGVGSRCSVCNGHLEERTSDQVKNDDGCNNNNNNDVIVPDKVIACHKQFFQCIACGKIYWEGDHLKRIRALVRNLDAKLVGRDCTTTTIPSYGDSSASKG